jgi:hypothetical protein
MSAVAVDPFLSRTCGEFTLSADSVEKQRVAGAESSGMN